MLTILSYILLYFYFMCYYIHILLHTIYFKVYKRFLVSCDGAGVAFVSAFILNIRPHQQE